MGEGTKGRRGGRQLRGREGESNLACPEQFCSQVNNYTRVHSHSIIATSYLDYKF